MTEDREDLFRLLSIDRTFDPVAAQECWDKGFELQCRGEIQQALACYEEAGRLYPCWAFLDSAGDAAAEMEDWISAVAHYRDAIAHQRKTLKYSANKTPDTARLATTLEDLASALWELDRYEEVTPLLRESLSLRYRLTAGTGYALPYWEHFLGSALGSTGAYQEAEQRLQKALLQARCHYTAHVPVILDQLAWLYSITNRPEQAAQAERDAEAAERDLLTPEEPEDDPDAD